MKLAIIIPAFNEELSIERTVEVLSNLTKQYIKEKLIDKKSYILVVDDGSMDSTWDKILQLKEKFKNLKAIKFSKNFGNQNAITAGYKTTAKIGCDAALTIDADLQQDETKIKDFIQSYKDGYEIVCGVRKSYQNKFDFKSLTSNFFYKFINFLGVNLKPSHSEYRLIGKKALDVVNQYKETNMFVRGIIYDLGFKTKFIEYEIKQRQFGESKFNILALCKMAVNAIVSFSVSPLRFVFFAGALISLISAIMAFLMLSQFIFEIKILSPSVKPYEIWETFATGMEILCIGIIGEYIGQILIETKARPRYIIEDEIID